MVKQYGVILTDVNKVRDYLNESVSAIPYVWYQSVTVEQKLKKYAENEYIKTGSDKALELIDNMDETSLKTYLKRLIKDNMTVGLEIIKDQK